MRPRRSASSQRAGRIQVVAGGGGVALVEDEVDDLEDGGEAGGELGAAGDLEGDVLVGEGAFGADDALGDGGFGGEEGAGDLVGGEAAEQTEGEGGAGLGGEDGMAGDEDEAEEVVADGVVESGVEVGRGLLEGLRVRGRALRVCARATVLRRKRSMARRLAVAVSHARGIVGNAGLRPLLECGDERLLGEVFGEADVAREAGRVRR